MNITPSNMSSGNESILNLNAIKTSQIFHVTDNVLKPKKQNELIERYKAMSDKLMSLGEYKRKYNEFENPKDVDISFYCYIMKVISQKNTFT